MTDALEQADADPEVTGIAVIGQSADAMEVLVAFIERRAPSWTASRGGERR